MAAVQHQRRQPVVCPQRRPAELIFPSGPPARLRIKSLMPAMLATAWTFWSQPVCSRNRKWSTLAFPPPSALPAPGRRSFDPLHQPPREPEQSPAVRLGQTLGDIRSALLFSCWLAILGIRCDAHRQLAGAPVRAFSVSGFGSHDLDQRSDDNEQVPYNRESSQKAVDAEQAFFGG